MVVSFLYIVIMRYIFLILFKIISSLRRLRIAEHVALSTKMIYRLNILSEQRNA